jgi:hypothetical protein
MARERNEISRISELGYQDCKMRDTKPIPTTKLLGRCED